MIAIKDALPFWEDLTKKEQEAVSAYAYVRSYAKGSQIYARDQECLGLIKALNGTVRTFMLSEEGREIVLYRMHPGDIDVLSASCVVNQIRFETQMVAEKDCTLLIVPAVYLAKLKEQNLSVRCFLFETLGERFSDVMKVMQSMLFQRIDSRIAAALLAKAETHGTSIPITHGELANEINSAREVVSRCLKEMEMQGMVRLLRGRIMIDPEKLGNLC